MPEFDVVGVGLNATDTLLIVPHFPGLRRQGPVSGGDSSAPAARWPAPWWPAPASGCAPSISARSATTSAAASRWRACTAPASISTTCSSARNCPNQSAYIIIDRSTGERTVLWRRDDCLRIDPDEITPEQITCARLLHIDGHDTPAVAHAAAIARAARHPGHRRRRHHLSRLRPACCRTSITWSPAPNFPPRGPACSDPSARSKPSRREYGMRVAAMTLGAHGSLALRERAVLLLARFRRELCGYHRRRRRVPRGLLLCCFARNADARCAGVFQRHGGPELHGARAPAAAFAASTKSAP